MDSVGRIRRHGRVVTARKGEWSNPMILDTLPLWHRYTALNPRFVRAFEFLQQLGPDPAPGRHEIDGDAVYALVQRYHTRPATGIPLEAHRRYIDIQYLVHGQEAIHWAPLTSLSQVAMPYDASKDAALFLPSTAVVPVPVHAGQFALLFPDDAHAPCCIWIAPADVLKVVVKVENT
jgi:biofilm protein TabA